MREIFSRVEEDILVNIEVEVDIEEYRDSYIWLFSLFVKPNSIDKESEAFEQFLEIKESMIISVEHQKKQNMSA